MSSNNFGFARKNAVFSTPNAPLLHFEPDEKKSIQYLHCGKEETYPGS
jgi:hypothetical protein